MSKNPVIALKAVTRQYGSALAVDGVSLSVRRGDMLVLLGSSGCGKTTTLRLIAGLERPDRGEIWLDGYLVAGASTWTPPEDRRIGMVFQDYALFPHLNTAENIAFPLRSLKPKQRQQRIQELLTIVGMEGLEARYPHQMSGGQQQRVALARALAPRPEVILLDEPFSNLDAALRTQVRTEVRGILNATGVTSVFVTHDQEEALSLGDQVAVMFDGKIAQLDTPHTVYTRPATRQVAAFVGEANFIPGTAQGESAESELGRVPLVEDAEGAVDLLIRPEAITLNGVGGADHTATVTEVEFFGHDQRISIRLDSGTVLTVRADAWQRVQAGERVGVTVARSAQAFPTSS